MWVVAFISVQRKSLIVACFKISPSEYSATRKLCLSVSTVCQCAHADVGEMVDPEDYTGGSDLPILLDDVKCTGPESNILSCPQLPLNASHDCTHMEDVAISCTGESHTLTVS